MDKTNMEQQTQNLRELDYAAWTRVKKGGNKHYVSLHAVDVAAEGIEKGDLVLVKLIRLKKYNPLE